MLSQTSLMFGRGNLLSQRYHILCKSEILQRGGIFKRFPQVKKWRLSIFMVLEILLKILHLQQIFRIVKMFMKILYLYWVKGTPQLCQFPNVYLPNSIIISLCLLSYGYLRTMLLSCSLYVVSNIGTLNHNLIPNPQLTCLLLTVCILLEVLTIALVNSLFGDHLLCWRHPSEPFFFHDSPPWELYPNSHSWHCISIDPDLIAL